MQALLAGESLRPLVDQDAPLDVSKGRNAGGGRINDMTWPGLWLQLRRAIEPVGMPW